MDLLEKISAHSYELNSCNQRGGRMLSIFDLLEAGTLDIDLAAYLMARISKGASFMVGAKPGGAGKTTIMCALLNFLPIDVEIVSATPAQVLNGLRGDGSAKKCFLCHEISAGNYFAYLWEQELRDYFALSERGHTLVTNLHADDLEEARTQVCSDNAVTVDHFNQIDLLLFIKAKGGMFSGGRHVEKVYERNGSKHELIYEKSKCGMLDASGDAWTSECHEFLEGNMGSGIRTIEETRQKVVAFLK